MRREKGKFSLRNTVHIGMGEGSDKKVIWKKEEGEIRLKVKRAKIKGEG